MSGIQTGIVDGVELVHDVVDEGVDVVKDIIGLNKDKDGKGH